MLIEFDSVIEAVRCAAALREAVSQSNQMRLPEWRVALRMGINLDDVIAEDGDIFGDGVNIAARLEALAEPGSVYVSEIVRDRVAGRIDFEFEDLGPHTSRISLSRSGSSPPYRIMSRNYTQPSTLKHRPNCSPDQGLEPIDFSWIPLRLLVPRVT